MLKCAHGVANTFRHLPRPSTTNGRACTCAHVIHGGRATRSYKRRRKGAEGRREKAKGHERMEPREPRLLAGRAQEVNLQRNSFGIWSTSSTASPIRRAEPAMPS